MGAISGVGPRGNGVAGGGMNLPAATESFPIQTFQVSAGGDGSPIALGAKARLVCREKTSKLPIEFWAFSSLFAAKSSAHGTGVDIHKAPSGYRGRNCSESYPLRLGFLAQVVGGYLSKPCMLGFMKIWIRAFFQFDDGPGGT
jgi:hypothetical protein